jgi:lipopolysaccharide biosynthesis glycosyltransferase
MSDQIHIALTFDDRFWAPAYATFRSICLASHRREHLILHAIHSGLSSQHRARIDALTAEFPVRLAHIDLADHPAYAAFVKTLPIGFAFSPVIWARLLLDRLVPEANRITYLDSDLLIRAPIEELALIDLQGKAIGAIIDPHRHRHMLGRDFREHTDLFDYRQPYFNSGVLVIDRQGFAAADLPGVVQKLQLSGQLAQIQFDQASLNLAFRDNWLPLDWRWNVINPQTAHENFEPRIVHYTGRRKPWQLLSRVAFAQAYRHTMTNDVFYDYWRERLITPLRTMFRPRG